MEEIQDSFLSIAGESRGVFREKASKFLSVAVPVATEEEVKASLEELKKSYHDANHHCYAYRLGMENQAYRINDDGEPSGSAGKPIYGQILSMGLSDILVVVVRYFGGTKLGIPGLIHAYRTAAREALEQAVIIEKIIRVEFKVTFDYPMMNDVMRILKEEGAKIVQQAATDKCEIDFFIRKSHANLVENRIIRLKNISLLQKQAEKY
ncbi:MAG: YigZ family protein [Bacteroidales bacterium]|nr:YigZ family protein [Bacteroidales bacterium]